ncbi:hypothetical protein [Kitasatospora sp. MAP5-34]|uniref:hypothetical protein n=1 Tax=Kitasatospora sp. MAP5-34 TaxID=3035102 RepID=UPI002475ED4E|nr:hypothetical protein [Kitasatospora sp. MAP5-34]MDH6580412.1 hypothetical protein [Kitasatospora sp. MAP5-34]
MAQRDAGFDFVAEAAAPHGVAVPVGGGAVDGERPASVVRVGGKEQAVGAELLSLVVAAAASGGRRVRGR